MSAGAASVDASSNFPKDSWWHWAFNAAHDADVAGWGFWIGLVGLLLTLVGFAITLVQLSRTKNAAEVAKQEISRVRNSMRRYDAAHEVSRASYALGVARKHFKNSAWDDGADSYSDFRAAALSLKINIEDLDNEIIRNIEKASTYVDKLCERVDKGELSQVGVDDLAKIRSVIRQHEQLVSSIKMHIQKGVF